MYCLAFDGLLRSAMLADGISCCPVVRAQPSKGITLIGIFSLKFYWTSLIIDHFTVACLVTWPLNESEAGGDLTLIETSWLFLCQ